MNTNAADTCHCLVRHPDKAKFLVVKHDEIWSPPVLMFPPWPIDYMANTINQGMLAKYGLQTRVLRPLMHLPQYHCVEMELATTRSSKRLKAVWVDQAEYMRTRTPYGDVPDPFERWFQEQELDKVPENRPPFHRPGWFDQADHWIQFQLDRLGIQVTGSVEQFRQGWATSSLLRVPTNRGWIYFKASYNAPPGEAVLTDKLAQQWPHLVHRPLVIDAQRNWMLNRDFRAEDKEPDILAQLPDFARKLASWQIDSRQSLPTWKALGVREVSLETFQQFCLQPDTWRQRWQEGGGGLSDAEWYSLAGTLKKVNDVCEVLANTGIASTLVHTDFRSDNMVITDGEHYLLGWSDPIIAHPFVILGRFFTDFRASSRGDYNNPATMKISDALYQKTIDAYLEPFAAESSRADLLLALAASEKLDRVWTMMRALYRLDWIEAMSPHYMIQVVRLQNSARHLIAAYA